MCYYICNKEGDKDGINYFLFNNILFRINTYYVFL